MAPRPCARAPPSRRPPPGREPSLRTGAGTHRGAGRAAADARGGPASARPRARSPHRACAGAARFRARGTTRMHVRARRARPGSPRRRSHGRHRPRCRAIGGRRRTRRLEPRRSRARRDGKLAVDAPSPCEPVHAAATGRLDLDELEGAVGAAEEQTAIVDTRACRARAAEPRARGARPRRRLPGLRWRASPRSSLRGREPGRAGSPPAHPDRARGRRVPAWPRRTARRSAGRSRAVRRRRRPARRRAPACRARARGGRRRQRSPREPARTPHSPRSARRRAPRPAG